MRMDCSCFSEMFVRQNVKVIMQNCRISESGDVIMNRKIIVRIILDAVMTCILVLLYNSHVFALAFHETGGLILSGLFIVHCMLNREWITSVTVRFFRKGLTPRVRAGYIINALLLIAFIFAVFSGIKTSQVLFPPAAENKDSVWRGIHHFSAAVSIMLAGAHIGMHRAFIAGILKRAVSLPAKVTRTVSIGLLAAMLSFGLYCIASGPFLSWLSEPFTSDEAHISRTEQNEAEDKDPGGGSIIPEDAEKPGDESKSTDRGNNDRPPGNGRNSGINENESSGRHPEGEKKSEEGSAPVIISTAAEYFSVISVFAAVTYYTEKLIRRKRAGNKVKKDISEI